MAAALRGAMVLDGDPRLLIRVQRLFPAPVGMPESTGPRSMGTQELTMVATLVRILDGNTFVVSDERGDIEASKTDPTGLFSYDMRFLSTWVLTSTACGSPPFRRRPPVLRGPVLPRGSRRRPPAGG